MREIMLASALGALAAGPAFAHDGVGATASLAAGLVHPLIGIDHLAVMVAVGMWAALNDKRALWVWPATFVGVMMIGGALGLAHVQLPSLEPAILASLLVLGILVALKVGVPVWAGALVIGVFAVFHGHAHGTEVVGTVRAAEYMAGFAIATASLHAVGIGFALLMVRMRAQSLVRMGGVACALVGAGLAAGVL